MKNINIKEIFIENADTGIISKIESLGAKVVLCDKTTLEEKILSSQTPAFNKCAVGDEAFLSIAKKCNIRCILSGADTFKNIDVKTFLEWGRFKPYPLSTTSFIEEDIDITDLGHLASVFALGNGYLGLRGSYDENDDAYPNENGMYINEIFETEPISHPWYCKGFATHDEYTVNLADWRIFEVYIDGEKACYSNGLKNHKRVLDFNKGSLIRTFEFTTKSGKTVKVESIRVINMLKPHSGQIKYSVTSVNFNGTVEIRSEVINNTSIGGKMPTLTADKKFEGGNYELLTKVECTELQVASAFSHKVYGNDYNVFEKADDNSYLYTVNANVKAGETVTVEKYAGFYSSADNQENLSLLAKNEVSENVQEGFDALYSIQKDFWKNHWETSDIIIDGCDNDQQAIRLSLFHLRSQVPTINNASIGATGLTGANYSGKVFWDTEMYLMPYYLFTKPELCKGLIMYRVKLLDKARKRAKEIGNEGALYSWCSIDGEETSVVFEASTAEYHINSDIAYSVWRYEKATKDTDFVFDNCVPMLFETAKFYAKRGTFVEGKDGRFCINAVCGPDEYACGVNNNCYTNFMVRFHFDYALDVYKRLKENEPEKLKKIMASSGITEDEIALWQKASDKMYYHVNEKFGVYEQDDRFCYNDAVDMNLIPKNFDIRHMFHPLDLWRIQVLKQADVVLLQFILGNLFTIEEKKVNYDYYEPKTNHGSSLSAAIHSIMATEIGYDEDAYEYFRSTAYMDIGDFKKNTNGGIHIACLGGVWMTVINGFMGMRLYTDGLHFNPILPKSWNKCSFKFNYQGAVMEVAVTEKSSQFTLISGKKLNFYVNRDMISLDENNKTVFIENVR